MMGERTKGREEAEREAERLMGDAFSTHAKWIRAQARYAGTVRGRSGAPDPPSAVVRPMSTNETPREVVIAGVTWAIYPDGAVVIRSEGPFRPDADEHADAVREVARLQDALAAGASDAEALADEIADALGTRYNSEGERATVVEIISRALAAALRRAEEAERERERVQGVVFVLVRDGHVLMERCPKKAERHGGEWFLPGGRVETGETPGDALFREMHEELGFVPFRMTPLPLVDATGGDNWGSFLMRPYRVDEWTGDIPPHCLDHPDVPLRWVPLDEARRSPTYAVRAILEAAAPSIALAPEHSR